MRLDSVTANNLSLTREEDPITGAWTSEDPTGFEGRDVDLYGFVSNKPTVRLDPLGLEGFGLMGIGSADLGYGLFNASGQAFAGFGYFTGNPGQFGGGHGNLGAFGGGGAYTSYVWGLMGELSSPQGIHDGFANQTYGLGGGFAAHFFFTSANTVDDLKGRFITVSVNAVVASASFSIDPISGTWIASIGPSFGPQIGVSIYTTYTWVIGQWPNW
jgi:hypothetical protein